MDGIRFQSKPYGDRGFHGDEYLLRLVDYLLPHCLSFIETGTNYGDTLAYVAHNYPHRFSVSCEPNKEYVQVAQKKVNGLDNVEIYNSSSQEFLPWFAQYICDCKNLFWLDAHGHGFAWPLPFEIEFITSRFRHAFILIDDFFVPGHPEFSYDRITGNICAYESIKGSIKNEYQVYYPAYSEHTSKTMGLVGWGLLAREWMIPEELKEIVHSPER